MFSDRSEFNTSRGSRSLTRGKSKHRIGSKDLCTAIKAKFQNAASHVIPFYLLATTWLVSACEEHVETECTPSSVQVNAEGTLVKSINLSGAGCENALIGSDACYSSVVQEKSTRWGFVPHCRYYYIEPRAAGDCTINVVFEDGQSVDKTVTFVYSADRKCSGFGYDSPWETWYLNALATDAGTDADAP
jgi:hypothetical protein